MRYEIDDPISGDVLSPLASFLTAFMLGALPILIWLAFVAIPAWLEKWL